jgi:hypothetical protein
LCTHLNLRLTQEQAPSVAARTCAIGPANLLATTQWSRPEADQTSFLGKKHVLEEIRGRSSILPSLRDQDQ